ncbi:MAG: hypothetical protein KGR98_15390 [Verrucomicrobia bacterium]|nr:hypothetical protein [Verrucomicrobiota bacterium]MDE3099680.1 hypothetical protein [Verrucomicrobiota bacterium]
MPAKMQFAYCLVCILQGSVANIFAGTKNGMERVTFEPGTTLAGMFKEENKKAG